MVELGIVEAVQQVNPTASVFRVSARHECSRFLVPHLDKADLLLTSAQCLHNAVDPIPGKPEYDLHTPINQPVDKNFCRCHDSPQLGFSILRMHRRLDKVVHPERAHSCHPLSEPERCCGIAAS